METTKTIKIVIAEDNLYYNKALTKYVQTICNHAIYPDYNFKIKSYLNAHDCIENLDNDTDIMILDYYLMNEKEEEVLNGSDVLKEVKKYCPKCKVIIVSSLQNAHITAELMQAGIYEYIDKNVDSQNRIGAVLQKMLRRQREKII